jgi:hypothetical protein
MKPSVQRLLAASVLSVPITLTHAIEDFAYDVHRRFGLRLLPAAAFLSIGYAGQILGAILSARGDVRGHWLNLGIAGVWLTGAVVEHLKDVLFVWPHRHGLISKAIEVSLMAIAATWAVLSWRAIRHNS